MRQSLATQRVVVAGGIVFPAIVLTALLFFNIAVMHSSARAPADKPGTVPIAVTGEQWWWRVSYSGSAGVPVPSANEIPMPVGRDVVFTLSSADVIHSFWIPSLGGKVDMIPGRETRLRVHADTVRRLPWAMRGVLRRPARPHGPGGYRAAADEFDAWLDREQGDAAQPTDDTERQGKALFLASGCGACHAVRGTRQGAPSGQTLPISARATRSARTPCPSTGKTLFASSSKDRTSSPATRCQNFGFSPRLSVTHWPPISWL